MTPLSDIAESIRSGDLDYLSDHSVRDRMRFVDACITELLNAIHPFIGSRRVDAYYESKVGSNVPPALDAIHKMSVVLKSMVSAPPPVAKKGTTPRHFHKTYKGAPTAKAQT